MKKILLLFAGLILSVMAHAQKSLLSQDENNKYIYYEVVDRPGVSADSLATNAAYFVKDQYPKVKSVGETPAEAIVKDKFLTYTALVKHESGEIAYTLTIECKDGKYRYWLTDFVFTPYQRNRYGNFVPVDGINIPIEDASSKVSEKELTGYLDQTGAFCKKLSAKLKKYMADGRPRQAKEDKPVKKIVTDKW
jgi:hypothetical protein